MIRVGRGKPEWDREKGAGKSSHVLEGQFPTVLSQEI